VVEGKLAKPTIISFLLLLHYCCEGF
jgi:hypothetical protein